jgi:hypothetical protein
MPLPPGTSQFPQIHTSGERQSFMVAVWNVGTTGMSVLGPFSGTFVPFSGNVQIQSSGQTIDIEARVLLPLGCGARIRGLLTNVLTQVQYEIYDVKTWADHVECFVSRSTADQ